MTGYEIVKLLPCAARKKFIKLRMKNFDRGYSKVISYLKRNDYGDSYVLICCTYSFYGQSDENYWLNIINIVDGKISKIKNETGNKSNSL